MIQYITAKDAAEKWNISQRRVSILCSENRIPDAAMLGNMWLIPRDAEKPADARKNAKKKSDLPRPFIKWAGGKSQLLDTIAKILPEGLGCKITKYAEPFVGGGALLFSLLQKHSFDEVYICDSNKELINAYSIIKDSCEELIKELRIMENEYLTLSTIEEKQDFYYKNRNTFNDENLNDKNSVAKAALFIFLNKTCFNGLYRVNKNGKFNVPFGKHMKPVICDEKNLYAVSSALKNVSIKACDYHSVETFADDKTLIYFDPPYRPLNVNSAFTSYTEDSFNDKDQCELAELYKKLSCKGSKIILSNSDPHNIDEKDDFFDDLYAEFNTRRIDAARVINSKASARGKIKEILITNY